MTRELPQRGEVSLRLNVSPLRSGEGEGEPLGVAMVVDDLTELRRSQRQAEEIQRLFGRYVHPAVVRQLLADPSAINLGGETREITVLFADIRGYTSSPSGIAPGELVRILNAYLDILTEAIWQEEGTLTMFIGDALMAIFNAPLPQPDHATRAVRAAWACAPRSSATTRRCPPRPSRWTMASACIPAWPSLATLARATGCRTTPPSATRSTLPSGSRRAPPSRSPQRRDLCRVAPRCGARARAAAGQRQDAAAPGLTSSTGCGMCDGAGVLGLPAAD